MKLGLLRLETWAAYVFPFLSVPHHHPFFLFLPLFGYSSPVVWDHMKWQSQKEDQHKDKSEGLFSASSLIQHPLLWWVGDTSCPGLFWLLPVSLALQHFIRAQPQVLVGLAPSRIRCHLMSPSPYSSQQDLPWCFFVVSRTRQPLRRCLHRRVHQADSDAMAVTRFSVIDCCNHCLWGYWLRSLLFCLCPIHSRFLTSSLQQSASTCGLFTMLCMFIILAEMPTWTPLSPCLLTFQHCVKSCLLRTLNIFSLVWKIKHCLRAT